MHAGIPAAVDEYLRLKRVQILFCLLALCGVQGLARQQDVGAQARSNQEAERKIVAQTISSVIGWAKNKDLDLLYSVLGHDTDYVSVSPRKRIAKRFEDVKQSVPF